MLLARIVFLWCLLGAVPTAIGASCVLLFQEGVPERLRTRKTFFVECLKGVALGPLSAAVFLFGLWEGYKTTRSPQGE